MKRFWKKAAVIERDGSWGIALDGKQVRTPGRTPLTVPSATLAEAIAREWNEVGETVEPRAMPLNGIANAAIDRVAAGKEAFAAGLAKYGESDLTCYRADGPPALVDRQEQAWAPLIAWARRRYDVDFEVTSGIIHVAQPRATLDRLSHGVASLDSFRLAALSPLVTIGGSLLVALAVAEGEWTVDQAWEAVSLDDRWQAEQWGEDAEAAEALATRKRDFQVAARFLELLG